MPARRKSNSRIVAREEKRAFQNGCLALRKVSLEMRAALAATAAC